MLVLARHVGEEIVMDGNIVLKVISCNGSSVRLGISAPSSVRVDRREVHDRRAEFGSDFEFPLLAATPIKCA